MHAAQHNRARLRIAIEPQGPMLIRSGRVTMDPTRPDLEWVRTQHAFGVETVYLPGSSLKGVVRSQAERILMTLDPKRVVDPFDKRLGKRSEAERKDPALVYRGSCAAARTFGSLKVGGRARFADAYPWPLDSNKKEAIERAQELQVLAARTGVAIDRRTGATRRGALYNLEVVESGRFETEIGLVNFQLWQLALLMQALVDIDEGFARIGSGKSRGLGRARCTVTDLLVDQSARAKDDTLILGTGRLCSEKEAGKWGLVAAGEDEARLPEGIRFSVRGLYRRLEVGAEQIGGFREALLAPWNAFLDADWKPEGK